MARFATKDGIIEFIISDPIYDIRSDGTIWAAKPKSGPMVFGKSYPWRQMDRKASDKNYRVVTYRLPNQPINQVLYLQVHRVIYRKYIGLLDPTLDINHIDGNGNNNHPKNLELATCAQNQEHALVFGLSKSGEARTDSKLTKLQVDDIRQLYQNGKSLYFIGKQYNIGRQHVKDIVTNKMWIDYS